MRTKSADDLFFKMWRSTFYDTRKVTDVMSPQKAETREAPIGTQFILDDVTSNLVTCKPVDVKWAIANTLHFLSGQEDAWPLREYNKNADKFLTGDRWIGAYGNIGMSQVMYCIGALKGFRDTRRAYVTLVDAFWFNEEDKNIPACIGALHFIFQCGKLHLSCYQRSLNLYSVMPYDLVLLTNVLAHVCRETDLPMGSLIWTIGSLHVVSGTPEPGIAVPGGASLMLPKINDPWKVLTGEVQMPESPARILWEAN